MSAAGHAVFHELEVAGIERLTDDSVAVTFAVPTELAADYAFSQGQHLTLKWSAPGASEGEPSRRNYSICSPVGGALRIGVKRIPDGQFSSYALDTMQAGDRLEVMTPTGRFTTELDPAQAKHYAMIAAGSGITPVLSIVSTILAVEPRSTVALLYGNRTSRTVMFLEELEDLKNRYPARFQLTHFLSREALDVELFSGRLDGDRIKRVLDVLLPVDTVDEWFLCGPFEMVTGGRDVLLEAGVDASHVHLELFHSEAIKRKREETEGTSGAKVTVTLDGRASVLDVARHENILDAMLKVRADAPYACKGGVCGTCRARLIDGEVEMDSNFALEPDELARGYVLTCQSYPKSDEVAVDYDG